jgi:Holliday junction DNA helicase RuvB
VSRYQWVVVSALGLLVAVVFGYLGAALFTNATPRLLQPLTALPFRLAGHPLPLVTFDNCLLGIVFLGLGGGLLLWRTRAHRVTAKSTPSYVPLYTCPICLAGPLIQSDRSRALRLRTTKYMMCRACGSTLEPAGDGYRYTAISPDYPSMKRHMGRLFHSWHELRTLAWTHPNRRQQAEREALRWERHKAQMSGERQKLWREKESREQPALEGVLEPHTLDDFLGQEKVKDKVSVAIAAAQARGEALGHILFRGREGSGKRTLAVVIAAEMGSRVTTSSAQALERAGDLAAVITNLGERDILFIDEVHRLSRPLQERLCPAMTDYALDIVIGTGASAKTVHLPLPQFTVIGATDQPDRVSYRLRELFEHVYDFEPYEVRSLMALVQRRAKVLGVKIDAEAALQIAKAAGGRMREAGRLLDRLRDYAQVRANGLITASIALDALGSLGIEPAQPVTASGPSMRDDRVAEGANVTWQEFEDFVGALFQTLGYHSVTRTSRTGDEGKDLVMAYESPLGRTQRVYVECKHWEDVPVGRRVLQILHSAVVADEADEGIVVTTSRFTNDAIAYAHKVGNIQLIDGNKLRELTARAGLQVGTESPSEGLTDSDRESQLERVDGEQGKEIVGVTGLGPATLPVASEEQPPKMTEEVQALVASLDDLSTWARRMFETLDQVHEEDPTLSAEHTLASSRGKGHRRQYRDAALRSLRSFRQVLDEVQQCLHGLQTSVDQWGLTRRTESSRLARQQQEVADYSSRYERLFDTAFEIYLSLRDLAPHPSLSDCHRDALEGMYYGLGWVLAPFVKHPAKEYEGKTLYLVAEAPHDLVRRQEENYRKLTQSAHGRLTSHG